MRGLISSSPSIKAGYKWGTLSDNSRDYAAVNVTVKHMSESDNISCEIVQYPRPYTKER